MSLDHSISSKLRLGMFLSPRLARLSVLELWYSFQFAPGNQYYTAIAAINPFRHNAKTSLALTNSSCSTVLKSPARRFTIFQPKANSTLCNFDNPITLHQTMNHEKPGHHIEFASNTHLIVSKKIFQFFISFTNNH